MKQFKMYTNLGYYDTFTEFMEVEKPDTEDFILTTEPVHKTFIAPLKPEAPSLFVEQYGKGEPTTEMVDAIRKALPAGTKRIFAIGGGSVMDIAKLLSLKTDGNTEDIMLGRVTPEKGCDVITIPTTCGTGSEATNACSCAITSLKTKRGLNLQAMYPAQSALIGELLKDLPYQFFATSSIDALVHAIESYLSPKANPHTELFSQEAIRIILTNYRDVVVKDPKAWTTRAQEFLTASNFAGIAFCNAGCAAVHALSYPLGGGYHIPHGEANQLMLAEVLRTYKAKQPVGKINKLEELFAEIMGVPVDQGLNATIAMLDAVLPRKPLKEYGISHEALPGFATGVVANQQRLLANNYVELSEADMLTIYETCY